MRRALPGMLRIGFFSVLLVLGVVTAVRAGDLSGIMGFTEFSEEHSGIAKELTKHPSLAGDPTFLKEHPDLANYLHDNPLARDELAGEDDSDEEKVLRQDEQRANQTAIEHARTRLSPPSSQLAPLRDENANHESGAD
jgi:hypothetical protein